MGISYDWDVESGTLDVTGIATDDDLGSATIKVNALMRRMKELEKVDREEGLSEEEDTEFSILQEFIELKEVRE